MMPLPMQAVSAQIAPPALPAVGSAHGFSAEFDAATARLETARDAAEQLVSTSLVLPILSSMREGPFLSGPFKPGTMVRRFGTMLDVHMAEAITSSSNFDLVDSVVDQIVARTGNSTLELMA